MSEPSGGDVGGWEDETTASKQDNLIRAAACANRGQTQEAIAFALVDIADSLRKLNSLTEVMT